MSSEPQFVKQESIEVLFHAARVEGIDSPRKKLIETSNLNGKISKRAQFIQKLWTMVNASETAECVTWVDDGTAFTINDQETFSKKILPFFFNHQNMASFERQMNFYSFSKMGINEYSPSGKRFKRGSPVKFKHTYFRQGEPDHLALIVRKTCPLLHENMESELAVLNKELDLLRKEKKDLQCKLKNLKRFVSTNKADPGVSDMIKAAREVWETINANVNDEETFDLNETLDTIKTLPDVKIGETSLCDSPDTVALHDTLRDLDELGKLEIPDTLWLRELSETNNDRKIDYTQDVSPLLRVSESTNKTGKEISLVDFIDTNLEALESYAEQQDCPTPIKLPCKRSSSFITLKPQLNFNDEPCRPLKISPITLESLKLGIDSFLSKSFASLDSPKISCNVEELCCPLRKKRKTCSPDNCFNISPEDLNVAELVSAWA